MQSSSLTWKAQESQDGCAADGTVIRSKSSVSALISNPEKLQDTTALGDLRQFEALVSETSSESWSAPVQMVMYRCDRSKESHIQLSQSKVRRQHKACRANNASSNDVALCRQACAELTHLTACTIKTITTPFYPHQFFQSSRKHKR